MLFVDESTRLKHYHGMRKAIHLACFLVFVALPFSNFMRFDIPRQRFYFAGHELWINEFAIIFFSLLFLMFLISAAALFYGRIYCGYLCPQMIFSEWSTMIQSRIDKFITKKFISWPVPRRKLASAIGFYGVLAATSVVLAFVFISYFVEPRDLLGRLLSFDIHTAGGIAGAVVTVITFLDFTLVRQRFCKTACPYGYLQGMLSDRNSLLVVYNDPQHKCIECKKCIRVCEMGIDIRTSPYQIECIHCGECVDACTDIMARLKKDTLIHYQWGESAPTGKETWFQKLGFRDAKRVVILFVLLFYAAGLATALSMRHNVLVQIRPERSQKLYQLGEDGEVRNIFKVRVANRGSEPATVALSLQDLPGARLSANSIPLAAGEQVDREVEISWRPSGPGEVKHFRITAFSTPDKSREEIDMTFLSPPKGKQ